MVVEMQILAPLILRLFRRPNVCYYPALAPPMHRLSPPSRPLSSSVASVSPRWWPPALERRVAPRMAAPSRPVRRVFRSPRGSRNMASSSGEKGVELGKPERYRLIPSANDIIISQGKRFAITQGTDNEENRGTIKEFNALFGHTHPANEEDGRSTNEDVCGDEFGSMTTMDITCGKSNSRNATSDVTDGKLDQRSATEALRPLHAEAGIDISEDDESSEVEEDISSYDDGIASMRILPCSGHRDGSIYRGTQHWKIEYCIADRNETRLEAMRLSDPEDFKTRLYSPGWMLQFFSIKLARIPVDCGSVELYGYIAVRDCLDPLLNYIVNISRDDPIIIGQGSLIEMTGPKRGIDVCDDVLVEYDMRIKIGDQEKDDLQLIDGVSIIDQFYLQVLRPITKRIHGVHGAVDITQSFLDGAVEATVDVVISEVQSIFELSLCSYTSGLHEEIQLFCGTIAESRGLRRYVVAVVVGTSLHLKFKVGSVEHGCYFIAMNHGCTSQQIKTELASISMKVTWSEI